MKPTLLALTLFLSLPALAQSAQQKGADPNCACPVGQTCPPCPQPAAKPTKRASPAAPASAASPALPASAGSASAPIYPPTSRAPTVARLPAQGSLAEERGRLLVAPKFGLFEPTSRLGGAVYLGAEVGYVTPLLDNAIAVVGEFDWYRPKARGAISDPRFSVAGQSADGSYSLGEAEFGVLVSLVYRAEDKPVPGLTPYGGLGPGLYSHRAAVNAFGSSNLETETKLGFQLMGGADYQLGPGAIFGEVRYHFARVDFRSTGNANVGGFLALGAGYRLRFF